MLTSNNVYSSNSAPLQLNPSPSFFPSSLFNETSSSCIVAQDHPYHLNGHGHGQGQSDFLTVQPVTEDPLTSTSSELLKNTMISSNYKKLKKDRRTKISTARGMRDRRVRLSMEIAREFFDLQDMLGFDKASKTLGWLLAESRSAINELVSVKRSSTKCSPFVCEEDNNLAAEKRSIRKRRSSSNSTGTRSSSGSNKVASKKVRVIRNQHALEAKKRRTNARERARERTMDKEIIKIMSNKLDQPHHQDIQLMKSLPIKLTSDPIPSPESSHLGFLESYSGLDTSRLSTNCQVGIDANRSHQHLMSFDSGSCDSNMIVKTLNCAYYYSIADLQDVNHGSDNMRSDSSFLSNSFWANNVEDLQHMSSSYLPLNVARL